MPAELDEIERRRMQLEIEREALRKEKDAASKARLEALERELADLRERGDAMKAQWEREKEIVQAHPRHARGAGAPPAGDRGGRAAPQDYAARRGAAVRHARRELEQRLAADEEQLRELKASGSVLLKEEVDADDIAEVVARWTGIPVSRLLEGETEKLLHMEERLHRRLIGQDEAVDAVSDAIRRARAGLKDPKRPIGSFIFLGPTGVGKTELARALAEFLFDDEQRPGADRHERVHGEVLPSPPGRRTARLRRLRGGRPAHRGGPPPAVPGRAVRRDREGPPRRLQRPAPAPRRRAPHRLAGPDGRLQEHRHHHDQQPRLGHAHRGRRAPGRRVRRGRASASASSCASTSAPSSSTAWTRSSSSSRSTRRSCARSCGSWSPASSGAWRSRGITLVVTDAALAPLAREGYDPVVRRPPAAPRHPARAREPAGETDPRRRVRAGRHDPR